MDVLPYIYRLLSFPATRPNYKKIKSLRVVKSSYCCSCLKCVRKFVWYCLSVFCVVLFLNLYLKIWLISSWSRLVVYVFVFMCISVCKMLRAVCLLNILLQLWIPAFYTLYYVEISRGLNHFMRQSVIFFFSFHAISWLKWHNNALQKFSKFQNAMSRTIFVFLFVCFFFNKIYLSFIK